MEQGLRGFILLVKMEGGETREEEEQKKSCTGDRD